ncbi:MAG TPA: hypothetical protein VMT00_13225 [Thermoanaerobaculia bacterium]|nr:hypothetical protein [Thermoanaerobaculia bacterium]
MIRYVKRGRSARFELNPPDETLIELEECGIAESDGPVFAAGQWDSCDDVMTSIDSRELRRIAAAVRQAVVSPVTIERLTLADGVASHRVEDESGIRIWDERQVRLFVSLLDPAHATRIELLLGGTSLRDIDLTEIGVAADALTRVASSEEWREPRRVRLRPAVAAALLPPIARAHPPFPHGVRLRQERRSALVRDGMGRPIEEIDLTDARETAWPNWFRPSYRFPPLQTPMHLRLDGPDLADDAPPIEAVALAGPLSIARDRIGARLLCVERDRAAFTLKVSCSPAEWLERIEGVGREARWYPYHAGSWGAVTDAEISAW